MLDKKILALQVELGELANEWRGFKFWSENQKPKPPVHNWDVSEDGLTQEWLPEWGYESYPLLEEYVDCLHFILSIGLELGAEKKFGDEVNFNIGTRTITRDTLDTFQQMFTLVNSLRLNIKAKSFLECEMYVDLFSAFVTLGDSLGFTEQQIEQAYLEKNKVNHDRQQNGY